MFSLKERCESACLRLPVGLFHPLQFFLPIAAALLTMKIPPNRAAMSLLSRAAHRLAT